MFPDNKISWFNWHLLDKNKEIYDFVKKVIDIRKNHVVFRRSKFFKGQRIPGTKNKDITWLTLAGEEMTTNDWHNPKNKTLVFKISGEAGDNFHFDKEGNATPDSNFFVIMNADTRKYSCIVPPPQPPYKNWKVVFDTSDNNREVKLRSTSISVSPRSFILLIAE